MVDELRAVIVHWYNDLNLVFYKEVLTGQDAKPWSPGNPALKARAQPSPRSFKLHPCSHTKHPYCTSHTPLKHMEPGARHRWEIAPTS